MFTLQLHETSFLPTFEAMFTALALVCLSLFFFLGENEIPGSGHFLMVCQQIDESNWTESKEFTLLLSIRKQMQLLSSFPATATVLKNEN